LRHFVRELTIQHARSLPLGVLDAFIPPPALLEGDAFRCLRRAAREVACCPREQRLYVAEVVEQTRAGEEVVPEGGGGRGGRGKE
jgi:hypothetical protein